MKSRFSSATSRPLIALVAALVLFATACSSEPGQVAVDADASTTSTAPAEVATTVARAGTGEELETEESESVPTTAVSLPPGDLEVGDDGWYPWIFPSPTLSWYEEGCIEPEGVARDFMANFFGDTNPKLTSLSASASPNERRYLVHSRGEGGTISETGTVLTFAQVELDIVDCSPWVLVSAESDTVAIGGFTFYQDEGDGALISVTGNGSGFEALIDLRAHDESFRVVADGFAMGGAFDVRPFGGTLVFRAEPIDSNLMLVAISSTAADGAIPQFAAVKARCCDGLPVEPEPYESLGVVAVIGVAVDDTLNVRSGPGVEHDVVTTLSPFAVGVPTLSIGDVGGWILVEDPATGIDGWVNSRFTTAVENGTEGDLLDAAFAVREALSSNNSLDRLTDVIAEQGATTVLVSTDAYLADEDQELAIEDFASAGSANDTVRPWGYTDGEGSLIEVTIEEHFSTIGGSSALRDTDRISVDQRIRSSNTIDNLADRFPNARVVELHHEGDSGDAADFTWGTLRLAFEEGEAGYYLVAIVVDNWTI